MTEVDKSEITGDLVSVERGAPRDKVVASGGQVDPGLVAGLGRGEGRLKTTPEGIDR